MNVAFRGAPPPADQGPPVYTVIAPQGSDRLDVTILDERILGVQAHWVKDAETARPRSRLCTAYEGDCAYCGHYRNLWLGFVGIIDHKRLVRAILRVSHKSAAALARHAVQFSGLRGVRLYVTLANDGQTSRQVYEPCPVSAPNPVPQAHAIERTVCLVLGCASLPDFRVGSAEDIPLDAEGGA